MWKNEWFFFFPCWFLNMWIICQVQIECIFFLSSVCLFFPLHAVRVFLWTTLGKQFVLKKNCVMIFFFAKIVHRFFIPPYFCILSLWMTVICFFIYEYSHNLFFMTNVFSFQSVFTTTTPLHVFNVFILSFALNISGFTAGDCAHSYLLLLL